jgi:hypothetical protein
MEFSSLLNFFEHAHQVAAPDFLYLRSRVAPFYQFAGDVSHFTRIIAVRKLSAAYPDQNYQIPAAAAYQHGYRRLELYHE